MIWNILVIEPDAERFTAHKFFTSIMERFIVGNIEIVDVSAGSNGLIDLMLLFLCWINLCPEAF